MIPALPTLLLGLLMGYLGQRSRLCFVSGYRDLLLLNDATLVKGVLGTFLGAFVGFMAFRLAGGAVPDFPLLLRSDSAFSIHWWKIVIGGLGVGFIGAIVGGCPFRMHVLAAEGKRTYWFYLLGFYVALILFEAVQLRRVIAVFGR